MRKLFLIIKREYWIRVYTRSFLLTTLLTPFGLAFSVVVVTLIFSYKSDNLRILIRDDGKILAQSLPEPESRGLAISFDNSRTTLDSLVAQHPQLGFDGLLYLPPIDTAIQRNKGFIYFSDKALGLSTQEYLENEISKQLTDRKIIASGYDRNILKGFKTDINIEQRTAESTEDKSAKQAVAYIIGGAMGFIIYIILIIYGTMVMKSVVEEKTSRIVEVIISSVTPFQLMLGKIIGVGLVGLTQLGIWLVLIPTFQTIATLVFGLTMGNVGTANQAVAAAQASSSGVNQAEILAKMNVFLENVASQNWALILPLFLFYFLGGYFLYAAMFAAVGSAAGDDVSDSQALTLPITIPVVLSIYIMFAVIQNPNSSLATWSSMIPLFSPIVMPARLPFHPAWWEIALSVSILAATVVGAIWLSGRIYRVGILMYGKKASFAEIGRWMFKA